MSNDSEEYINWLAEVEADPKRQDCCIARITCAGQNIYGISHGDRDGFARISGRMKHEARSALDYPAVGDRVLAEFIPNEDVAVIHETAPRSTVLQRKTSGKRVQIQLIAANIDTAFIVQALDKTYNLRRIERFLVLVNESNVHPVVLLSKADLQSYEEIEEKMAEIAALMPGTEVFAYSTDDAKSLAIVSDLLHPDSFYCLLGTSGAGKSTLINCVLGEERLDTQEVRESDGKGRHTTTLRQMITLPNGACIVDTPGVRELGAMAVETGINDTYAEVAELAPNCRFSNCTHSHEDGCAILTALEAGTITQQRYDSYLKMRKESEHNARSYHEKRSRDKQFSKLYKSVKQTKKKYRR